MPIFNMECLGCGTVFEYLQIRSDDFPVCPECRCCGSMCKKIFNMMPHIRMNSDDILHSMPDPSPPLRELIGKGTEGFKDLENDHKELKEYKRTKDAKGNVVWLPKERKYFYGKGQDKRR